MKINFVIMGLVLAFAWCSDSQHALAQDTQAKRGPNASIEEVAWIAGPWKGEAMEGQFEETWSPPSSGTMMGMFKFSKKNEVVFYEFLTIAPHHQSLILRIKHFHGNLVGWESKDKSVEFPLVKLTAETAEFDGLIFRKISDNEIHIEVVISSKGESNTVIFKCHRADSKTSSKPKTPNPTK